MLTAFRQRYPKIEIDIDVETTSEPPFESFDVTLLGVDQSFNSAVVARKVIEADVILVASPACLHSRGTPRVPEDLCQHDCLRLRQPGGRPRVWQMRRRAAPGTLLDIAVTPAIVANHTDTLLRATLDGAGITSVSMDIVAPYLARGELVRVLSARTTGRLAMYAALPSRKFIPQRSRVFLDFLVEQTRLQARKAMQACPA